MTATKYKTTLHRLRDKQIATLTVAWTHDGGGLYVTNRDGRRSFVFRYMQNGRPKVMGLGSCKAVSLAAARKAAAELRGQVAQGRCPATERKTAAANSVTFRRVAEDVIEIKKAEFKNAKHAAQWGSTLETYAFPVLGDLPVTEIDVEAVLKVLRPIWKTKTETASRVRMRIEAVLNSAYATMRPRPQNPATWKGVLSTKLAKPSKVKKLVHFEAMNYADLPGFFAELRSRNSTSARAIAWTILTVVRTSNTRNAKYEQIADGIWTIPADEMKSDREFRAILPRAALDLLDPAGRGLIFPNRKGEALSDAAMRKYLQQDMKRPGLTVHGFRSTFKQWVKDNTHYPDDMSEMALAHVISDKTRAAYDRSDMVEKRRQMMDDWARYCLEGAPGGADVVPFRKEG